MTENGWMDDHLHPFPKQAHKRLLYKDVDWNGRSEILTNTPSETGTSSGRRKKETGKCFLKIDITYDKLNKNEAYKPAAQAQ